MSDRRAIDEMDLSAVMDFEHVICVHADGTISEPRAIYAPEVYWQDGAVDMAGADEWSLLDGYSRQDRYSGPVMHASELIGRYMARDILATPGLYAAVVIIELGSDNDDDAVGWAIAYREDDDG